MPVYNGERHLAEAIESVLAQSHRDFEFVIVDDGSTDGSSGIIDRYAARDARIRVIRQANAGGAAARNTGIEAAKREFVAMLDQDDAMLPHRLATQLAAALADPDVLLWSGHAVKISDTGRELGVYGVGPTDRNEYESYRGRAEAMLLHGPAFFAKKDVYTRVGGYLPELALVDDTDLANRVAELGPVQAIPEPINRHRYHAGSATFGGFFRQADLAGYVWARTAAAAQGRTLTLADYQRDQAARGALAKRRDSLFIRSRFYFRCAGIALAGGRRPEALLNFVKSAICYPPYFTRRVVEQVRGRSHPDQ